VKGWSEGQVAVLRFAQDDKRFDFAQNIELTIQRLKAAWR